MSGQKITLASRQQNPEKASSIGILQRTAVRSVPDTEIQTQDNTKPFASNSAFCYDFTQIPLSDAKLQPNSGKIKDGHTALGQDFSKIHSYSTYSPKQAIQTKLTIGEPGDKYEQEADRVAAQVVNQINAPVSGQSNQNLQREEMSEEDELMKKPEISSIQREVMSGEDDELQMKQTSDGAMAAPAELESSIQQARGSGQPLADNIRKPMEQAFGADFSGVKVHTDGRADHLNQSIQAKAFTTGQDVFFRQGEYQPGSLAGQELLAHELTHVMQQGEGVVHRSLVIQRVVDKTVIIEAIRNNTLSMDRRYLLSLYQLAYRHHNDKVIFLRSTTKTGQEKEAANAQCWYRTMTRSEFDVLNKHNRFHGDSYGGIAPLASYARGYLTNDSVGDHVVEFETPSEGYLYDLFHAQGWNVKAEGGGTFGLGPTGTAQGEAGVRFNNLLARGLIAWELIDIRIPNPY